MSIEASMSAKAFLSGVKGIPDDMKTNLDSADKFCRSLGGELIVNSFSSGDEAWLGADCVLPKKQTVSEVRILPSGYGISTTAKKNNRGDMAFKKGTDTVFRNIQEKMTLDQFELGNKIRKMEFGFFKSGKRVTMIFDDEL